MASYENMVTLSMHILESVRSASPDTHVVFLSSAAVYGKPKHLPVREDTELAPISPYGTFKSMTELLVNEYRQNFGISGTSVRIFSAYGERLCKQVLWDLCCRATEEHGEILTVRGNPCDSRDFIHASDVARAIELVAYRRLNDVVNLGSGRETEIQKIAWIIRDILSPTKEVVFTGSELQGYPARWCADMNRLASQGFLPMMTLDRGLENYCLWFAREHKGLERTTLTESFTAKLS
jgi:UDP-glucose 4-epimerase